MFSYARLSLEDIQKFMAYHQVEASMLLHVRYLEVDFAVTYGFRESFRVFPFDSAMPRVLGTPGQVCA